jgi:hypothetical protein
MILSACYPRWRDVSPNTQPNPAGPRKKDSRTISKWFVPNRNLALTRAASHIQFCTSHLYFPYLLLLPLISSHLNPILFREGWAGEGRAEPTVQHLCGLGQVPCLSCFLLCPMVIILITVFKMGLPVLVIFLLLCQNT